jgi:signal peptidase I
MRRYVVSITAAAGLLMALLLRNELTLIIVTGDSMWPALAPGDHVLVRRRHLSRIRPGQVVVFEAPGVEGYRAGLRGSHFRSDRQWMIKRVAAVPGDLRPDDILPGGPDRLVPPGKFVAVGDNAVRSHDSRHIGYIPSERLLGVVVRHIARTSRGDTYRPANGSRPPAAADDWRHWTGCHPSGR